MMNGLFGKASSSPDGFELQAAIYGVCVSPGQVYQRFRDINQVLSALA
jgi:hypothetical protein